MDKASITRIVFAVAALVKLFGVEIPEGIIDAVVDVVAAVVVLWAAWKNNYVSKHGQAQKDQLKRAGLL
jgi:SPP1 family holin